MILKKFNAKPLYDALIFLREPTNPSLKDLDINDVLQLCDTYNIPVATNLATAELIILSLDRGDLNWCEMYR